MLHTRRKKTMYVEELGKNFQRFPPMMNLRNAVTTAIDDFLWTICATSVHIGSRNLFRWLSTSSSLAIALTVHVSVALRSCCVTAVNSSTPRDLVSPRPASAH